jgi:hypothetical protein
VRLQRVPDGQHAGPVVGQQGAGALGQLG